MDYMRERVYEIDSVCSRSFQFAHYDPIPQMHRQQKKKKQPVDKSGGVMVWQNWLFIFSMFLPPPSSFLFLSLLTLNNTMQQIIDQTKLW